MGEIIDNNNYAIKADGTIVRSNRCPHCGKESISGGEYCKYCGQKLPKMDMTKGIDYEMNLKKVEVVLWIAGIILPPIGIIMTYIFNSVLEYNGVLYFRYSIIVRKRLLVALVLPSVLISCLLLFYSID